MRKVSWSIKLIGLFTVVLIASLLFQLFYMVPYAQDREVGHTKDLQAIPEGSGRLVLESKVKGPEQIAVSISDTGEGIPEKNMEKLFEPLFTAKVKAEGIGLGLAITNTLVEGNRGTIEVKSELGVGSTFTLNLPILVKE